MSDIDKLVAAILAHAATGPMATIKDVLDKYEAILRELSKPHPSELKDRPSAELEQEFQAYREDDA
jgi:hypothetical protein